MNEEDYIPFVPITPQKDIDWALEIEKSVQDKDRKLYLECLCGSSGKEGKIMSERNTPQEIRDGCILTGIYVRILKSS